MSLTLPTTQELADNEVAQMESSLSQSVPLFAKAFVRVLSKVHAAVDVLLYKYCGFIFLQLFVAHATDKEVTINGKRIRPLVEWGRLIGEGDPTPATRADLVALITVQEQVGWLPAGAQLVRAETGIIYQTVFEVLLSGPVVRATIRASSDQAGGGGEGTIGNLVAGDKVSFASPLPYVATDAFIESVAVAGADAETTDAYRARVMRRYQRKPQGGAYADYQQWGEEVEGIVHVYPYTGNQPGTVDVYVEAETTELNPDGLPSTPQVDAVLASIELSSAGSGKATRRPANAAVIAHAITRVPFDVQIAGLIPDTPAIRTAIETGIDEYLRSREPFIVGLSSLPRDDRVTAAAVSGIVDGIVSAEGASVSVVSLAAAAYTLAPGEKAKLGTPTYI